MFKIGDKVKIVSKKFDLPPDYNKIQTINFIPTTNQQIYYLVGNLNFPFKENELILANSELVKEKLGLK